MPKSLIILLLTLFLSGPAWPQEDASGSESGEPEATEAEQNDDADEIDDSDLAAADLDEQTYEEDEDDFVPSEEIPTDQPIPFPSNI